MRCVHVWLLLAAVAAVEVSGPVTPPAADSVAEFTIADPPAAWRTLDTAAQPVWECTSPDRRVWKRAPFWDGERVRIRHTPRAVGVHRWRLLSATGVALAAGEFTALPAAGPPGPLQVAPANRRLLAFADGTPFIPIGPNLCWAGDDAVAGFTRWFALLAAQGCNHTRIWMCNWSLGIESDVADQYRFDRAAELDAVLAAARAASIRITLVLDNHTDVVDGKHFPYGDGLEERQKAFFAVPVSTQWERRLRYIIARWGADDAIAMWELMNEPDMAQPIREFALPWVEAALALIQRHDPDHRLRTVSWCGTDWPRLAAVPGIDVVQVHDYVLEWQPVGAPLRERSRDGVGLLLHNIAQAEALGHPVLFGETGFQGTNETNPGNDLDHAGMLVRQQAWGALLGGGCGSAMNWWWDTYLEPQGLLTAYAPLAAAVRRIDWRDPELSPLTPGTGAIRVIGWTAPRQALLWAHDPADTWHAHLIAGSARRGLPTGMAIRLISMQPDTTFTVTGLAMDGAPDRDLGTVVTRADGSTVLPLPAAAPELVLLLKAKP